MKLFIQNLLAECVENFKKQQLLPIDFQAKIIVDNTKDKKFGDFASNIAMMLSKPMKNNPRSVAEKIIELIGKDERIKNIEIAGPGFINFYVNDCTLEEKLLDIANSDNLGFSKNKNPKTVVVDYSSPNVAKEMAVHHIRSTVIGDSVVRVLEFLGNNVIRANHVGDWGTQFGMLIAYLEKMENENATDMEISDLEGFYRLAKELYDEDETFATKARDYVVKLQSGDAYCRKMWQKLVDMTMKLNQKIYDRLNVSLSNKDIMGESLYNDMLPIIVDDLIAKKMAIVDDGALVVYLDEFKGKDGNPQGIIVRKKDGGFLYTTTDIACIKYRVEKLKADRIMYFIDSRQHTHMLQVWEIARKAGYVPNDTVLEHEAFGMMLGKDGRPFKTRSGGTVKLANLLDEAETRARKLIESRNSTLNDEEKEQVIHEVAMGAVKYADLSKNRTTDYIFDWDNMLTFEGNTAPYLQYAYTRIKSIFRKTNYSYNPSKIVLSCLQEKKLAEKLIAFEEIVNSVAEKGMPHILCTYLFELSGLFMSFYEACPINKDDVSIELKNSRLTLCDITAKTIKQGLNLLGINTLEKM